MLGEALILQEIKVSFKLEFRILLNNIGLAYITATIRRPALAANINLDENLPDASAKG